MHCFFVLQIQLDLDVSPSSCSLMVVSVCIFQLLQGRVKRIFSVWDGGEMLHPQILQTGAIKKEVVDGFLLIVTQGARWFMVFCYPTEMRIQLNVVCPQPKDHNLFFSIQNVDGVFFVWLCDKIKHRPTRVIQCPLIMPFNRFVRLQDLLDCGL